MQTAYLSCSFEARSEGDSGRFRGVASTDELDSHGTVIEPGAFMPIPTRTNGRPDVFMFREHNADQIIGGWESITQEGRSLVCEGRLCLDVAAARETYALMRDGLITGLSVGFFKPDAQNMRYQGNRRHISKAKLHDISVVAQPSNRAASVTELRSDVVDWLAERGCTLTDIERAVTMALEGLVTRARGEPTPEEPWGTGINYADPGYQEDGVSRYPLDVESRIRSAWSYIHMPRNQEPYTAEQVERIKQRIIRAWKETIDPEGPPAYQEDETRADDRTSPEPREGETSEDFVSRCMHFEGLQDMDVPQRAAVCWDAYRRSVARPEDRTQEAPETEIRGALSSTLALRGTP